MAVCVFFKRKCTTTQSLKNIINYILDDSKTKPELSSGFGVIPEKDKTFRDMMFVKRAFNKTDKRQYIHFTLSFKPGEVTPELAKEVSEKIAEYYAKDYQVLMAIHTDKPHIHCHFCINSVNMNDGKKFRQSKPELEQFKMYCNTILDEYKLCPILKMYDNSETTGEYRTKKRGNKSWKDTARYDIWEALRYATTKEEFIKKMKLKGYDVKWSDTRKNITFTAPNGKKVRDEKLGFSKDYFENAFVQNKSVRNSFWNSLGNLSPEHMEFPDGILPPDLSNLNDEEKAVTLSKFYSNLESERQKVVKYNEDEQERIKKIYQIDYLLDVTKEWLEKHGSEEDDDEDWEL